MQYFFFYYEGANIVLGRAAPIRALVEAMGHAATVLLNEQQNNGLAVPSTLIAKGDQSALIIGADDEVVEEAGNAGLLYGAYHNWFSSTGASALWNGSISSSSKSVAANAFFAAPLLVAQGKVAFPIEPVNLCAAPKRIFFYEKGAGNKTISAEEAKAKLLDLTDENKEELISELLKDISTLTMGKPSDVTGVF